MHKLDVFRKKGVDANISCLRFGAGDHQIMAMVDQDLLLFFL